MEQTTTALDWPAQTLEQLTYHWEDRLRPRLEGLTDEEYHWEPVPGCWGVRRRGTSTALVSAGRGDWTCDFAMPEPSPAPVTTIAWRMAHLVVGVLGARAASHFGAADVDYPTHDYAGTASEGLAQLDATYAAWVDGVRALPEPDWARQVGDAEGQWAEYPMASLVLHISREMIHHGAEMCLMRDLWEHQPR